MLLYFLVLLAVRIFFLIDGKVIFGIFPPNPSKINVISPKITFFLSYFQTLILIPDNFPGSKNPFKIHPGIALNSGLDTIAIKIAPQRYQRGNTCPLLSSGSIPNPITLR
mmetsp:Transcript_7138/g.10509  ORF Transcript_7138/g.10509 Transcript_7138/m.10509 type:complete len:110 (-) Transcript_7138:160-489(-)